MNSLAFNEYRERLPEFTRYGNVVAWGFEPALVFADFEQFRSRLMTVAEILNSAKDYGRLDKMEIGGIKGRAMGQRMEAYFKEYHDEYEKWVTIKFNPLDLDQESNKELFERQFKEYKGFCEIFERKLANIFIKAFQECRNFEEAVQLLQMAGSLLKRPQIFGEIKPHLELIVDLYVKDVEFAEGQFQAKVDAYKKNGVTGGSVYAEGLFPPVSGTLMWVKSLKGHVKDTVKDLDILAFP